MLPMSSRPFVIAAILAVLFVAPTGCVQRLPGTALGNAARSGDLSEIDRLVKEGANVNEPSYLKDWPPVIHAISKGQVQALVRLRERGASLAGEIGDKAIFMATGYGDVDALALLLSWGLPLPQDTTAAASLVAVAIGGAWDYDYEWSGCERHTQVVRLLLDRDPNLKNVGGFRPASMARTKSALELRMARLYARMKDCDEMLRIASP
jgi:hypothetical protein